MDRRPGQVSDTGAGEAGYGAGAFRRSAPDGAQGAARRVRHRKWAGDDGDGSPSLRLGLTPGGPPAAHRRTAAISAAARTTRGPTLRASSSASATTPTLASIAGTPITGAAIPCAPTCNSPSLKTYGGSKASPRRWARIARPPAPRSSECLDPTRYATW